MPRRKCVYALYHGDELIITGTAQEIADRRGIKLESVYRYNKPSQLKRYKTKNHISIEKLGTIKEVDDDPFIHENVYEMYIDGELKATGTAGELAEIRGVKRETIQCMSVPSYKKRVKSKRFEIVKIGKTTDLGWTYETEEY